METCRFCGEVVENAGSEIAITLDGEKLVRGNICSICRRAVERDEYFRGDAIGVLICELDNNLWCEFCKKCPCNDGSENECEIQFSLNCPSIRKAIAEETK